jgi:hypothetical protein
MEVAVVSNFEDQEQYQDQVQVPAATFEKLRLFVLRGR